MKTIAVIPCRNEAKHIAEVVSEAAKYVDKVIVSDGRSTNGTRSLAREAGAKIRASHAKEIIGYGACVKRGFAAALVNEADIIVLLDGDGQHNPAEIPKLLEPIKQGKADIVMGQRLDGNMPRYRRFGNKMLTAICNTGARFRPPDALCGYWAVSVKALPKLTENKWGVAVELLIKSRANGCRMMGVPIEAIYHDNYEDNSSVPPLKLGLSLLWLIIKWRLKVEVLKR